MGTDASKENRDIIPVLIVGGGPVGLALAVELGLQGIRSLVVEQTDGAQEIIKVMGVGMRTMEFCRRWGIIDEVREKGYPKDHPRNEVYFTSFTGYLLACQEYPPLSETVPPRGVAEKYQLCPSTVFNPIMQRLVETTPEITMRYEVRCDHVAQDRDGVTAILRDLKTGKTEEVRAHYVVSCEGAVSSIRKAIGIELNGIPSISYSTSILFRSEELPKLHDKGPARSYWAVGPEGLWTSIYAINGRDLWRLAVRGTNDPEAWERIDADECLHRVMGRDFEYEIIYVLPHCQRMLIADRYRDGRIFLCGDSARQLSPQGNLGMNTGLADAVDLAWKLRAMLDGWGGPALLDSYEADRRPIGERNIQTAAVGFNRITSTASKPGAVKPGPHIDEDSPAGEKARRKTTKSIEKVMYRRTEGAQIGHIYENSPVCVADGTPAPEVDFRVYNPTTYPGARAPHAPIAKGKSVLDLYGQGFVLLRLGPDAPEADGLVEAAGARGLPLVVHAFDLAELTELYERRLVLVRPDGHVAWRGDTMPADCLAVIDRVRGAAPVAKANADQEKNIA